MTITGADIEYLENYIASLESSAVFRPATAQEYVDDGCKNAACKADDILGELIYFWRHRDD